MMMGDAVSCGRAVRIAALCSALLCSLCALFCPHKKSVHKMLKEGKMDS